jgi:putative membrane protein
MMGPGGMMGRGMMRGWGPDAGFVGGGGFGLLFLLLLIVGVVLIVSGLTRRDGSKADDALQILRGRLARGEITKEQFDELKEALK